MPVSCFSMGDMVNSKSAIGEDQGMSHHRFPDASRGLPDESLSTKNHESRCCLTRDLQCIHFCMRRREFAVVYARIQ